MIAKKNISNKISNEDIADVLDHIAELLEVQENNVHRVRAYRNGANGVRETQEPLADMVKGGDHEKLQSIPGIGEGLARLIFTYITTGESSLLNRLQGEVEPEELFAQVPSIGEKLAHRISKDLDIHTLEELEQAAYDGRLLSVEGFGTGRVNSVQMSLAGMLSQSAQRRTRQRVTGEEDQERHRPGIETLLRIDSEYRKKAKAGELRKIAPKRFNPEGKAWLPVFHTQQEGWDFTALYSNTARAHELGMTQDWVVIYYARDKQKEDQATVVTKTGGPLDGKRVVRGREAECLNYYEQTGK